jgi:hypothetical protein
MTLLPVLDPQGQQLLAFLVSKLPAIKPSDPRTFVSYKDVHDQLKLPQVRETYGESLKAQGLVSLADWTVATGKPGVTGIVIDRSSLTPGKGYFTVFGKREDDFSWWGAEVLKSKTFDWSPYLPSLVPPAPPVAVDIAVPPGRIEITTHRIIRDTPLARRVKQLHNFECQLCGHSIELADGSRYAEAHHVQPLGEPHNGPDIVENIVCLCPNHHVELDYGTKSLSMSELRAVQGHTVAEPYIKYHNEHVRREA